MRKKLILGITIFLAILFGYCTTSQAAILVTNKQVNSEEQFNINITSDVSLISYKVVVDNHSGLTFINSSGGAGAGTKKVSNALTTGSTKQLATFTFKAPKVEKDTQYTITFTGSEMGKEDFSKVDNDTKTATITVKAPVTPKPEPEPEPEPTPDPKPENPTTPKELEFATVKNKTVYLKTNTNFRSKYEINNNNIIKKLPAGTELIQTGVSKTESEGYIWSKVVYNGQTGYVINENLTPTKPEEPTKEELKTENPTKDTAEEPTTNDAIENNEVKDGLKSLEIEGITLSPTFSPDVYEYRAIVKKDVSELKINAVAAEGATITIAGNEKLQEGENLITIVVYNAKNEVEATYQITTNKSTLDLTYTDNLLKAGTQSAKRNLIIFIAILAVAIIALIFVMILKHRNEYYEDDYEEDDEENYQRDKLTNSEETVENVEEETTQEEIEKTKKEKRKGKHF